MNTRRSVILLLQWSRHRCLLLVIGTIFALVLWNASRLFSTRNASSVGSSSSSPKIPMLLHQVSETEMVFSQYSNTIESCLRLNPNWTYVVWRDSDAEALIKEYFPDFYTSTYQKYTNKLQKSDAIRYIILYLFGGIYIDMDVECKKPFFPELEQETCFIDQENPIQTRILFDIEWSAMNSAMGCRPGHPFMQLTIDRMRWVAPNFDQLGPLGTTGPFLLTQVLKDWWRLPANRAEERRVRLLDLEVFSPLVDSKKNLIKHCRDFYNKMRFFGPKAYKLWISRGCRQLEGGGLREKITERNVGVHWFMHLGWLKKSISDGLQRFNISQTIGRVKFYVGKDRAWLRRLIDEGIAGYWVNHHVRL